MSDAAPGALATYRRLLGYARRYWMFGALAVIGMMFDAAATGFFTWLIEPMLDQLFVARDPQAIAWMPAMLVGLFVLRGIATYLGDAADVKFEQLRESVESLLDDEMERKGMTRCARNMIDGRGPDRVVNGMEIILHTPSRKQAAQAVSVPAMKMAA